MRFTRDDFIVPGVYTAWVCAALLFMQQPMVDEVVHMGAVRALMGDGTMPSIPMFPGYHWCVAILSRPLGPSLVLARLLTFTSFIGCVVLFASLTKHKHYRSLYTLALLPLLFPYVTLLYTDILGLFWVLLGAVPAQRKWHVLAAPVLVCACLVRQSNGM